MVSFFAFSVSIQVCEKIYIVNMPMYWPNCIHSGVIKINFLYVCVCALALSVFSIPLLFPPHHQQRYLCSSTSFSETYAAIQAPSLKPFRIKGTYMHLQFVRVCVCTLFSRGEKVNIQLQVSVYIAEREREHMSFNLICICRFSKLIDNSSGISSIFFTRLPLLCFPISSEWPIQKHLSQ